MRTQVLLPEALVAAAALGCLLAGRLALPRLWSWLAPGVVAALVAALGLELWLGAAIGKLFQGGFSQDRFALFMKAAFLLATLIVVALTHSEAEAARPHRLAMVLLVCFAGMVVASSTELVGLWAALALAVGAMAAVAGDASESGGAALRRLVAGGVLLAMIGAGLALLYGMTGVSQLYSMRMVLASRAAQLAGALAVALVLTGLVGLMGLALGVVDSEELGGGGASPLETGAGGGLTAGVAAAVLFKLVTTLSPSLRGWAPFLAVVAAAGVTACGLTALAAVSPRLQAAFVAAGQLCWVVAGGVVANRGGQAAALFLFATWLVAATSLPAVLELAPGTGWRALAGMGSLGGLGGLRAAALLVCLLTLAGVPPLGGWFGQFAVLSQLARTGWWWLVALGLLAWLVSVAGVFRMVRTLYLDSVVDVPTTASRRGRRLALREEPEARALPRPVRGGLGAWRPPRAPLLGWAGAGTLAAVLVLYAVFANPVYGLALQAAAALAGR